MRLAPSTAYLSFLSSALVACASPEPAQEHQLDAAAYEALPLLATADGARLCLADGYTACPLRSPVGNWLTESSFAIWEPGKLVQVVEGGSARSVGAMGRGSGQYALAVAVGPNAGGITVVDGVDGRLVRFGADGSPAGEASLPALPTGTDQGYSGSVPVRQRVTARLPVDGPSTFSLHVLSGPSDPTGQEAFSVPLPWMSLGPDSTVSATPLFVAVPRYAVDRDRQVVWSPGDSFEVRRTRPGRAEPVWTTKVSGLLTPVTPEQVAAQRRAIQVEFTNAVDSVTLDSMARRAAATHPAVSGILLDPMGGVMVAPSPTPPRDTLEYLLLQRDGAPRARVRMPSPWRPMLFAGDSVLVHRPTEGEVREVIWVQLRAGM